MGKKKSFDNEHQAQSKINAMSINNSSVLHENGSINNLQALGNDSLGGSLEAI